MMKFRKVNGTTQAARLFIGLLFLIVPAVAFSQVHKSINENFRDQRVDRINTESELRNLYNVALLPTYINETEVHQISSYDRKGGNNDGFEGTYSYLKKNDDGSLVVFEAKGKGVIERIWTPTPTDDTLEFYFDGAQTPSYSIKYQDIFSGKVFPFVSPVVGHKVGGFYSYLPIPYEKGCKIVFKGKKILFHQFQYRKLNDNYIVKTFNPQFSEDDKRLLNKISALWNNKRISVEDVSKDKLLSINTNKIITPGQSVILANLKTGGRIAGIELEAANGFEGLNNLVDLKVTWDSETTPAIYAPVADFFGFAFGSKSMKSLLIGVDSSNRAYCFIPMPFDKNAKIELVYRNAKGVKTPVTVKSKIYYSTNKRDVASEGKFYANWKREEPALGKPYAFLDGKGKGHYVGTILQSQGTSFTDFTEFFEGDDSTVIDGVNSIHGTGSEDYFNGGWYAQAGGWVERLGTALHGCLDYSLPYSRTGGYRFYLTDKLPFNKAIYHSIEHGPERNNRPVNYTSIAMYYSERPVEQASVPTNITSKVFIPDTLTFYPRLMDHLTYSGKMSLKNGDALLNQNEEGAMNINVNELEKGSYELYVNTVLGKLEDSEVGLGEKGNINWRKVGTAKSFGRTYYVGDVSIKNPKEPISVMFKANSNKVQLNRAMLIKK
jgi:hypothetical protein